MKVNLREREREALFTHKILTILTLKFIIPLKLKKSLIKTNPVLAKLLKNY